MFEDLFIRKKLNQGKLISYGFNEVSGVFKYAADIISNHFTLNISIYSTGKVDTSLIENETGEEYILYKTDAEGTFVGKIRSAIEAVLSDISEKCYEASLFKTVQAQAASEYVKEKYGDDLEFLWSQFPDTAVWRRKDNQKWYGLIQTVKGSKLGLQTSDNVEIINLRAIPDNIEALLSNKGYCPGWHMNKKHWFGIVFDSGVSDEEIYSRIDESYQIAKIAK